MLHMVSIAEHLILRSQRGWAGGYSVITLTISTVSKLVFTKSVQNFNWPLESTKSNLD